MTLATTVPEAARRFGDRPAFVAAGGWPLTYGQLDRLSDEAAAGLHALGLREGDVLALTLPSTPEYLVAYAAAAKLGAITAGVNPRYTAAERAAVLAVAQPALVLTTADLDDPDVPFPRRTVTVADQPDGVLADIRDLAPAGSTAPPLADADDPDRVVCIVFTSGTTGTPKGAVFGNRELAAITRCDVGDRWDGGGPMVAATQFAHVGMMTKLPWYLRLGTTTYLLDRWNAGDVLRLVAEHRITSIGGVAPQVALMLRAPEMDELDLSCVETIIMGGAFSPPALVEEARRRFGAAYSIRYSSTESGGIGLGTAFDADDEEAHFTVGRPRGDVEIAIRDDEGDDVEPGEVGELCLRSSCMLRGYWNDPDATAATLRDAWLHTGDLARLDDRGLVRLAGRRKEMYIRGGYNVYPVEVEAVLASHPAVADVAVVPRPHPVLGETGVAVVVPRDPAAVPTLDDLTAFARERLATYKLPEDLLLVDELPLTAMQKVDRRALQDRVAVRDQFGGPADHTG